MLPKDKNSDLRETPIVRTDVAKTQAEQDTRSSAKIDRELSAHLTTLLTVSSGMVGVCLTAIGLVGIMQSLNQKAVLVDDLLAVASLMFVIASLMSFFGMRSQLARKWRVFTRVLDGILCLGFMLVVVATMILTWLVI